jgi:D-xylose transport system ATP-binding protein
MQHGGDLRPDAEGRAAGGGPPDAPQAEEDRGRMTSNNGAILSLEGVSKSFGAVQALDDVAFEVHPGEVVALVGDNGAGKSTLVKTIAGIHHPDSGKFFFNGEPVTIGSPSDATRLGIATVYQDLALADNLDVVANLFLGQELVGSGPAEVTQQLDEVKMEHRSHELLEQFAVTIPSVRTEVGSLSGGQRQQVAVARSLLGEPKVVLLDEPTAALGIQQTAQVLELIKRLRERGLGVVVISHNLVDVFAVADRIFVLRLGRPGGVFDAKTASQEDVVAAITGVKPGDTGQHEAVTQA